MFLCILLTLWLNFSIRMQQKSDDPAWTTMQNQTRTAGWSGRRRARTPSSSRTTCPREKRWDGPTGPKSFYRWRPIDVLTPIALCANTAAKGITNSFRIESTRITWNIIGVRSIWTIVANPCFVGNMWMVVQTEVANVLSPCFAGAPVLKPTAPIAPSVAMFRVTWEE